MLKIITKFLKIKKEKKIIITLTIAIFVIAILQYNWMDGKPTRSLALIISKMTEIKDGYNWNQMGEQERKSKYRQMMIRILTVYGYQYDPKFKKAMNKDEKIKYINFNYEAATKLNFGLFDVPVIHLMETSFNPYADGGYSERGLGQVKYNTALLAERIVKFMPDKLRRLLDFTLKRKADLYDPIINTKAGYALLWYLKKEFKGREDWYISTYHWGGFLSKRWDKGRGEVPLKFTLNNIEYNVIKYYITFRELKEAFETGQLEAGKAIEEKWAQYHKKMVQEEIDYRRTKTIIRNLRRQLVEKREIEKKLDKKHEEIDLALNSANVQLKKISGESQTKGRASLRKVKTLVKTLLQKIKIKN